MEGKRIAILATNGIERRELEEPRAALQEAGGYTELLSLESGTIDARDHDLEPAGEFRGDRTVADAAVADFDGARDSGRRRRTPTSSAWTGRRRTSRATSSSRASRSASSATAWTLVEADVLKGRTLTSCPSHPHRLRNAGAIRVDEEVARRRGPRVQSRNPDDLPAFCRAIVGQFATG